MVWLRLIHDALPEQIKVSSSIHLPFQHLQSIDVPFGLAAAPRISQRSLHSCIVLLNPISEVDKGIDFAFFHLGNSIIKLFNRLVSNHKLEFLYQIINHLNFPPQRMGIVTTDWITRFQIRQIRVVKAFVGAFWKRRGT